MTSSRMRIKFQEKIIIMLLINYYETGRVYTVFWIFKILFESIKKKPSDV